MHMTLYRRGLWRLGRKLYCWGRGDFHNDPETNGEYWLLDQVVGTLPDGALLLDVGANRGDWTLQACELLAKGRRRATIHAFEPCAGTRALLETRLADQNHVHVSPQALSSLSGEADFFSNEAGLGINSLHPRSGNVTERVPVITLDRLVEDHGWDRIAMVKIDAEGFDCEILRGAQRTLAEGRVDVLQFEYNWRWLLNRSSLLDVFTLIQGTPYRFGKLSGRSIVLYDAWHSELDRFFEGNYVLIHTGCPIERLGELVHFDGTNTPRIQRP